MTRRISIKLAAPANDMVQEEIIKQVAFLSVDLRNPAFGSGDTLECDLPPEQVDELTPQIQAAAGDAHIFPGAFLKAATPGASYSHPYVMVTYVFLAEK